MAKESLDKNQKLYDRMAKSAERIQAATEADSKAAASLGSVLTANAASKQKILDAADKTLQREQTLSTIYSKHASVIDAIAANKQTLSVLADKQLKTEELRLAKSNAQLAVAQSGADIGKATRESGDAALQNDLVSAKINNDKS